MSDRMKQSRMLTRFDQEIVASKTQVEADCKRAERAAYQARLGFCKQANEELETLRDFYKSRPRVEVSAWLNLVDGLIGHFKDMNSGAREKILRSHALSSAAGLARAQALSAAWLAHMDYLRLSSSSMAHHAEEALRLSTNQDHAVRSRVGLVIAQAYHLSGRLDLALPWYASARNHAVAEGDDATLSALMHNMAWLRAQRIRVSDCGLAGEPTKIEEHALLSAESTASFDLLIGSESMPSLVSVLRAQVLTVRKHYSDALALFEAEMASALGSGMGRLQADLLADQAWCRIQLGQRSGALDDAESATACIDPEGQFDDRALAHARLAQVFAALGQGDLAASNSKLAVEAWASHVNIQKKMLEALALIPKLQDN